MKKLFTLFAFIVLLTLSNCISGEKYIIDDDIDDPNKSVWVYDYPDVLVDTEELGKNLRSSVYDVRIRQNEKLYLSYVLADYNTFPHGENKKLMTNWNHSTCFSFKGTIQIEITKKNRSKIGQCKVYPLKFNVPFTIENERKLIITLDKPRKLYVEMEGMDEDPLFIFADAMEKNIPDPAGNDVLLIKTDMNADQVKESIKTTSKNIIYFEKGIHSYGDVTDKEYAGYQLPLVSDKTYYIPGGAYIIGSFYGEDVHNTTMRGRGIVTGCGKERLAKSVSIPYNIVMFAGSGAGQVVEGITITNPPHFCILTRGKMDCVNVKMFGWWHQTDGFGGNEGSLIEDCFLKVNDDVVKIYRNKQIARNLVIYKQINGAAFQLGWGPYGSAHDCHISDIYIVKDDPKTPGGTGNTAIVNLRNNGGSEIKNLIFENVYVDNNVQRTLGITLKGGLMENIVLRNFVLLGKNNAFNYLHSQGKKGQIKGITIENMKIMDKCIINDEDFDLDIRGIVEKVNYVECD